MMILFWGLGQNFDVKQLESYHRSVSQSLSSFQSGSPYPYEKPLSLAASVGILSSAQNPVSQWPNVSGSLGLMLQCPLLYGTQLDIGYLLPAESRGWEGWLLRGLWQVYSWPSSGLRLVASSSLRSFSSSIGNIYGLQYGIWIVWQKRSLWIAWGNHIQESQTRVNLQTSQSWLTRTLQPSLMAGFQATRWRWGLEWSNIWNAAGMFWISWIP